VANQIKKFVSFYHFTRARLTTIFFIQLRPVCLLKAYVFQIQNKVTLVAKFPSPKCCLPFRFPGENFVQTFLVKT